MELLTNKIKKLFSENINKIFENDFSAKIDIQNSTKKEFGGIWFQITSCI